jgi:hypothetical protein
LISNLDLFSESAERFLRDDNGDRIPGIRFAAFATHRQAKERLARAREDRETATLNVDGEVIDVDESDEDTDKDTDSYENLEDEVVEVNQRGIPISARRK